MQFEDQVRNVLRQLQEFSSVSDNLKSTQERCNVLLEENRALKRDNVHLQELIKKLIVLNDEQHNEPDVAHESSAAW